MTRRRCCRREDATILFPGEDCADIRELVEGLERREVVYVEVEDFVAYLREDGVVELEEA